MPSSQATIRKPSQRVPATQDRRSPSDTREEHKFPLPAAKAVLLSAWLSARMPRDPRFPEGIVTSCYYDTPELDSYQESADGEFSKQKLRLRWYGDPIEPLASVWLEVKFRAGARTRKYRTRFPTASASHPLGVIIPTREELTRWLRSLEATEAMRLNPTVEPTALVRYRRMRWQSADRRVRASLDVEVRAASPCGAPIWLPVADGTVLELKSEGALPPQLAQLGRLGLRRAAHSKYALAIEHLYSGERPHTR